MRTFSAAYLRFLRYIASTVTGRKALEVRETDKKQGGHPKPLNWRKYIRTVRDVGSIISLIVSLLKILQELGIL